MSKKEELLQLLDLIEQQEQMVGALMSASERDQPGDLERWAPKDVLCHNAGWSERQIENIQRAQRGEPIIRYDNYLEINDQDFIANQALTWENARQLSIQSRQAIIDLLANLSEEDLLRTDILPAENPRPLWRQLVGNAVEHPSIHLGMIYNELGHSEDALPFQEALSARLSQLDVDDQNWQANVIYNMACQHALSGQKAKAIDELRQALKLNPGLTEWSKEDSDLVSLREDPEYKALY